MTARAAVQVADRSLEVRALAVPDEPPVGGALLRVEGSGMCGSDVEQYEGVTQRSGRFAYPVIPGHEIVGRIAALHPEGAARWGLSVGDRVGVHGTAPCGVCRRCRDAGRCSVQFYYGFRSTTEGSGLWGGYAEYLEVAPNTQLHPISSLLPVEDAVLFNPLAAGFDWVVREGGTQVGDTVLVLGSGQRGLASVIAAREAGASEVIVTGLARDEHKLELARRLGATATLVADRDDVPAGVRDLTAGRGVDKVIETTPNATRPVLDAIESARPGGTVVLAGLKGGRPMPDFPVDEFVHKQLRMIGVLSTSSWAVDQAIRVIESGRYPLADLHSGTHPLEEVDLAVRMLAGEVDGANPVHLTVVP
jgi:threonine dehydrogenase-like Zn-dependent dehydrogenase